MAQLDIKQIRGASQGSVLFLGTNSIVSEDYSSLNWSQSNNILYVGGQIQMVDGSQQSGYVLTTDANGLATWSQSQTISEITISGTQNGSNRDFVLSDSLTYPQNLFFINGQLVQESVDYTISGTALTIDSSVPAPISSDTLRLFGTIAPLIGGGILSFNGLSNTYQYFTSSSSDGNIDININSSIDTHSFDVNVLFNDSGTSSTDVWSANQIISYVGVGGVGATGATGATGSTGAVGATGATGANSALMSSFYKFDTSIVDSDPGSGYVKLNTSNPTASTLVWIDYLNSNSVDVSVFLGIHQVGDRFYIQDKDDSSQGFIYSITSVTDKVGYYEFGLDFIAGTGSSFTNNENVLLSFVNRGTDGVAGATGATGSVLLNGLTASVQYFTASNDTNVYLNIDSVGSTHSFNLSWNGLLPIDRGGLSNSTFTASQVLIMNSTTSSVVSSGYTINDNLITNSNLISAQKVIEYSYAIGIIMG